MMQFEQNGGSRVAAAGADHTHSSPIQSQLAGCAPVIANSSGVAHAAAVPTAASIWKPISPAQHSAAAAAMQQRSANGSSSNAAAAATHTRAQAASSIPVAAVTPSSVSSSFSASAALALKRALDAHPHAPLSSRKLRIKDVLQAPLWQSPATAAAVASAGSSTDCAVAAASSSVFAPTSLSIGLPPLEIACARVMGTVIARVLQGDRTAAHFMLQDASSSNGSEALLLRVTLPAALLFAAMPLPDKIKAQENRCSNTNHAAAIDVLSPLPSDDASVWMPALGCVLDVSGTIELCRSSNTRRLFATSYQLLRSRPACDGKPAFDVHSALQQRDEEITALYAQHLFRPAHAPSQQQPQQTPLRAPVSSTHGACTPPSPARPLSANASTAAAKSPSSPFSSRLPSSSEHKRTGMSAALMQMQRRPVVSKLAFPAALPLPLPLPAPQSSYFDEFLSSSQEDQAHMALADRYMGQRQMQQQQPMQQYTMMTKPSMAQPMPYAQMPVQMQSQPQMAFPVHLQGAYAPMPMQPQQQTFSSVQPVMHHPMQSSPMPMRNGPTHSAASFATPPPNRSFVAPAFSAGAQFGSAPKPFSHATPASTIGTAKRPGPTTPVVAAAVTPAAFNAPRPFVKSTSAAGAAAAAASGGTPASAAASALAARIAALNAAATAAPPPDDADVEVGFASGLGAVVPSEAARKAAEAMRARWDREEHEKQPQAAAAFSTAAASSSNAASAAAARSPSPATRSSSPPLPVSSAPELPPPGFVPGFSSGRGRALEVSAEARALAVQKAQEWEEEAAKKEGRAANKAEAAAMAAAAFASSTGPAAAAAGGFSSASKPKPFKPPAQVRPIPARGASTAAAASSSSSSAAAVAASAPAGSSAHDPVALRKSKLALLGQQLGDWESGAAVAEDDGLATADGHSAHKSSSSAASAAMPSFSSSSAAAAAAHVPRSFHHEDDNGEADGAPCFAAAAAPPGFVPGFSTGLGKPVSVSDAAQKRAREIMAEVEAAAAAEEAGERGSHREKMLPRSSAAAAAAASPASSAAGFSSGGFGSAKPFKPPSSIRPRTTATNAAAAPVVAAAAAATTAPEHDAAAIRRAKMAALDKQLEALEAEAEGTAPNETASSNPVSFSVGFSSAKPPAVAAAAGFQTGRGGFARPAVRAAAASTTASAETPAARAKRVQAELMADLGMSDEDMLVSFDHNSDGAAEENESSSSFSTANKTGFGSASSSFGAASSFGSARSFGSASSSAGFGSAASFSRASSKASFEAASASDEEGHASGATTALDFTSPVAGRKRILSQIDEEEPNETGTQQQQIQQQHTSVSSHDAVSTVAAPPITSAAASPLWSPPSSVAAPSLAPSAATLPLQFTSPPSSLSSTGGSSFFSQASTHSNAQAQTTSVSSQQNKRQRIDQDGTVAVVAPVPPHSPPASALATVAAATPVAVHSAVHVAPTPIPIAPFSPMSPPRPSGAVAAGSSAISPPSSGGSGTKHSSPPGSASQIYIPATPSLEMDADFSGGSGGGVGESQLLHGGISASLEKQFDLVADDDDHAGLQSRQTMHEEQGESLDQQLRRVKEAEKKGALPPSPTALAPPAVLPYLPPSLSSLSPAAGSPASLRLRAAARVSTFGAAAPPPSCSVDHVLYCLLNSHTSQSNGGSLFASPSASSAASSVPSSAGSSFSSPAPSPSPSSSRASLWARTFALLGCELDGDPDASRWSAEKRADVGKLEPRWKHEFEQSLNELEQQGRVHCSPQGIVSLSSRA